ncbi:TPA: hypothetical protein ACKP22_004637 [Pseudomonas putida]
MKIKYGTLLAVALFLLFCGAAVAYFYLFSVGLEKGEDGVAMLTGAVNAHDHFVYVDTIARLARDGFGYELNNDVGISYFYLLINEWFFDGAEDYLYLALYVNLLFLLLSFICYIKICDYYGFGAWVKCAFFAGVHLLYFAQLINKDMSSVFLILFSVYAALYRHWLSLLLMIPLYALVRQQLLVYVALFIFIQTAAWPLWRIVIAYVMTSLVAAYLVVHNNIIGSESLEDGFSALVYGLNAQTYLGYLLLNPIRVLQFIQDSILSFFFILPDGSIDMGRLLRTPQILLLILMAWPLWIGFKRFRDGLQDASRPLYSALFAYLMAWLMNPTVNARYVMLIAPVLVLIACYAQRKYLTRRVVYA